MKELLSHIHTYLRRKLKELKPQFITVHIWVPKDILDGLQMDDDDYVEIEGSWPNETVLSLTPIPEEE